MIKKVNAFDIAQQHDPGVWPICATCRVAWILRRTMVLEGGEFVSQWIWHRDCRHRSAEIEVGRSPAARGVKVRNKTKARARR